MLDKKMEIMKNETRIYDWEFQARNKFQFKTNYKLVPRNCWSKSSLRTAHTWNVREGIWTLLRIHECEWHIWWHQLFVVNLMKAWNLWIMWSRFFIVNHLEAFRQNVVGNYYRVINVVTLTIKVFSSNTQNKIFLPLIRSTHIFVISIQEKIPVWHLQIHAWTRQSLSKKSGEKLDWSKLFYIYNGTSIQPTSV